MKKVVFLPFLFLAFGLQAQTWTDSLSMNIRTSSSNPNAVNPTKFRLWIPGTATDVKALILVSARGIGFNNGADGSGIYGRGNDFKFALNPIVRKMASETRAAILCFQGSNDDGIVTNFDPGQGHADSLLKVIDRMGLSTGHPELKYVPFIAFGHSLGSVFSQNIALWNPLRVAGTILYQTGGFVSQPTWTSSFNPAMDLKEVPTLMTSGECEGPDINNNSGGFYAEATFNRTKSERIALRPFHQIIRRNGSHSILMPLETEMIAVFIKKAIQYRIPPSTSAATSQVSLIPINQNNGWLGNLTAYNSFNPSISPWNGNDAPDRFWLFDEEYANQWKKYHAAPISYTLSRTGPFCVNDTFTVYYSCAEPINFGVHNQFRLEMSSVRGDFDSYSFPIRISGSIASTQNTGSFKAVIPDNLQRIQAGSNTPTRYRFRLVSTQPVLESNNGGEQNIGFCSLPESSLFTYLQNGGVPLQFCMGTSDSISLSIGRLPAFTLNAGNQLNIQLSDSNGSFANPVLLRTVNSQITSGGSNPNTTVKVGLPPSVLPGRHYRLRAVSTNPAAISTTCGTDLSVIGNQTQLLNQNGILSAPYGSRYQWLRDGQPVAGAIFQSFRPEGEGSYSCQVFQGSCGQTTETFVPTSIPDHVSTPEEITLYPNPAHGSFFIQAAGNEKVYALKIFDFAGQLKSSSEVTSGVPVPTDRLVPGFYQVHIQAEGITFQRKLVVSE
jgi:hypothetical protein